MAPFLLIFSTVLVLVSVHIMVLECSRTHCPSTCSCLGTLVDCARRGLVDVPSDLPVWVQILDLQHNNVGSLGEAALSGLDNLTEIDLSHNQLRFLNGSHFGRLPALQKLILNHNHLTEMPDLGRPPALTTLSLQHNSIHSLPSALLEDLPRLQVLDLSFNHLVDLPADTFGNSTSLLYLSLSHNHLVGLAAGVFDPLTSLLSLRLSKNRLEGIPTDLFRNMPGLQHLELNSNHLLAIEGLSFQGLSSLVVLKMRHSAVRDLLDGSFYGLASIRKMQLDYNNIRKITKGWLYGLNSLQRLYVNNNNISEIEDDAWDSGKRLLELDLSHNRLQSVTSRTFDKLYTLKRLILSHNAISYIEDGAFKALAALQYLELSSNAVSWSLEDSGRVFSGLSRLRQLGLSSNGLHTLDKTTLGGLNRLESLDLTHNPITRLDEGAFSHLTHLRELTMNSSSLLCDCHLSWMSRGFPFEVRAVCGYPPRLSGRSVFDVEPADMPCGQFPLPVLTSQPPTQITLKGENITLHCQATSNHPSPTHISWRKDGRLLPETLLPISSRRGSPSGNGSLTRSVYWLPTIRDEDEGKYQCVASNVFGSVYSERARITVHVFPTFTRVPRDQAVRAGGTARLECGAHGQPPPQVTWRKEGGGGEDFPAARERRMHVMPTDDVFFITGVRHSDAGRYSCTAQNVAGKISADATLTVLETPSFVKRMEDKEVRAGETAVLECLCAGSPRPTLHWSRDGAALIPSERHFFTAGEQLLIVVQAQPQDEGLYTCQMTNSLGSEKGSSRLRVLPAHPLGSGSSEPTHTTTGVIVIAVVICIVGTSVVWVVIIYHTRKRTPGPSPQYGSPLARGPSPRTALTDGISSGPQGGNRKSMGHSLAVDAHSGHSKDSGQQSSDDLLVEDYRELLLEPLTTQSGRVCLPPPGERHPLLHRLTRSAEQLEPPVPRLSESCSTFPRSVTLASVSQWSEHSPRFKRLPRDIPNDSGSFSMAGDETLTVAPCCPRGTTATHFPSPPLKT